MREHELFKSHVPVKREGTLVGYRETPYMTILGHGFAAVTIKNGQFFGSGGGEAIDPEDLPDAFWQHLERLNPVALAECGIDLEKLRPVTEIAPKAESKFTAPKKDTK